MSLQSRVHGPQSDSGSRGGSSLTSRPEWADQYRVLGLGFRVSELESYVYGPRSTVPSLKSSVHGLVRREGLRAKKTARVRSRRRAGDSDALPFGQSTVYSRKGSRTKGEGRGRGRLGGVDPETGRNIEIGKLLIIKGDPEIRCKIVFHKLLWFNGDPGKSR